MSVERMYDVFDGTPLDPTDKCRPRFFNLPVENKVKSREAGHPVFEDVEMVEIFIPGDAKSQPCHKVRPHHIKRWEREYASFKNGHAQKLNGTPLEQWPGLSAAQIATFHACNIRTVQDIIGLNDSQLSSLGMGAREIQARATAWLEQATGSAVAERLAAENARKDEEMAELRRQMAELQAAVAANSDEGGPTRRGPGRPPKSE